VHFRGAGGDAGAVHVCHSHSRRGGHGRRVAIADRVSSAATVLRRRGAREGLIEMLAGNTADHRNAIVRIDPRGRDTKQCVRMVISLALRCIVSREDHSSKQGSHSATKSRHQVWGTRGCRWTEVRRRRANRASAHFGPFVPHRSLSNCKRNRGVGGHWHSSPSVVL
jgi:hypothetical protein